MRHDKIVAALRDQISSGTLEPGVVVPTVQLARKWTVTPMAVMQAVKDVADEGRIRLYPGYGYVVCAGEPGRCGDCEYLYGSKGHMAECNTAWMD